MTAHALAQEFEMLSAEAAIDRVLAENTGLPCFTCSFQAEDMIVLDLLRKRVPDIPVLFLETGYHFAATYAYRDRMTQAWNLNLKNLAAKKSVAEQEAEFGILNRTDPGKCCNLRKVEPLFEALQQYDVWFTGLRREQSPTRKNLKIAEHHELASGKVLLKVSPLAAWTWGQVWKYTADNKIDYLPLYDQGYRSIGCEPCTAIPQAGADPRSGRWSGAKLECGIHTASKHTDQEPDHDQASPEQASPEQASPDRAN
jgi:phosphoadenosine phosphosulfate reductase